jgi:NAD(P)-dependent dehydrogenase (short-subunit alcohol dehydrogenase family)
VSLTTLAGRKVFITGAASGIGRAAVLAVAREGAILFLTDIQRAALEQTARDAEAAGGTVAHHRALDIADRDAIAGFAADIAASHGSMDVVMNVAGIATWGLVQRLQPEDWRRTVEVDLMGPIHVIDVFVPPMIRAGRGGHLINVSSAAGLFGLPWHAPYSAAKFGLRGVSEVLRFDLRRHGIGVTLVCPGGVDTPLADSVRIVGLDRERPEVRRFQARFRTHAVSPEAVAAQMLDGMRRGRYLVFTSRDMRLLWWAQRFAPPLYAGIMRLANDRFWKLGRQALLPEDAPPAAQP